MLCAVIGAAAMATPTAVMFDANKDVCKAAETSALTYQFGDEGWTGVSVDCGTFTGLYGPESTFLVRSLIQRYAAATVVSEYLAYKTIIFLFGGTDEYCGGHYGSLVLKGHTTKIRPMAIDGRCYNHRCYNYHGVL